MLIFAMAIKTYLPCVSMVLHSDSFDPVNLRLYKFSSPQSHDDGLKV